MSSESGSFKPDVYSEGRSSLSSKFNLDEYVRQAKSLKTDFIHDLEHRVDVTPRHTPKSDKETADAQSQALQKMKEEAARIQEEARQQGYQEGHEEGYQAGANEVRERFTSSLEALQSLIEELSGLRKKSYPLVEREMVTLITTLARKVIRAQLKDQEDGIREIIRMAVESILERESLVIKVHPDDHKELEDYGQELIQLFHDIKHIVFEPHGSVARSHCVVESNFGTVEAGLDHLDEHIARILNLAPPAPPTTDKPEKQDAPEEPDDTSGGNP